MAAATTKGEFVAEVLRDAAPHRHEVYESLKLGFTDDGLAGKMVDGEVMEHPIYACYVIQDLLLLWRMNGKSARYLEAAEVTADAAIARMQEVDDGLVYMYAAGTLLPDHKEPFYSALTQARYLIALSRLAKNTGRKDLSDTAHRVFRSLMIPSSRGGVMLDRPYGPVLEEYPNPIPTYILNGWTSALVALFGYANTSGDAAARDFAMAGCDALMAIIDRFDVPELANTRYTLAGFTWLRLIVSPPRGVTFTGGAVTLPADGTFEFVKEPGDRWLNWYAGARVAPDGKVIDPNGIVEVNAVLSRSADDFRLRFDMEVEEQTTVKVYLPVAQYDVLDAGMRVESWNEQARFDLEPGQHSLDVAGSMSDLPLIGYPTNFNKRVAGRTYNAYHIMHCSNLQKLQRESANQPMVDWLVKWVEYVAMWPRMPVYRDADVELTHVPNDKLSFLDPPRSPRARAAPVPDDPLA